MHYEKKTTTSECVNKNEDEKKIVYRIQTG